MTGYRPGRSRVARLIDRREKQRARIDALRKAGDHELADQLDRLGRAVDQRDTGVPATPAPGANTGDTPADPPAPWWDR